MSENFNDAKAAEVQSNFLLIFLPNTVQIQQKSKYRH